WREVSYSENNDVWRIHTVCAVSLTGVNNWVRMPYIPRGNANRLYIEMKFSMRTCDEYPHPENLSQCKETFDLLYYEAESDFANSMMPTWDASTYKKLDTVAADRKFTDINHAEINTETRSIPITRKGVYFAFRDMGSCTSLIRVKVYYIQCPSTVVNFAIFPNTSTAQVVTDVVQTTGRCVEYAAAEREPSYLCKSSGIWYLPSGGCKCISGYQPEGQSKCTECPVGTYKWETGSGICQTCPSHSYASSRKSVECTCDPGYFRSPTDSKSKACTRPPSNPRNLSEQFSDQSTIRLQWDKPTDKGGRDDLTYRVACEQCRTGTEYLPARSKFNHTHVTLTGLYPNTEYTISIYAENGVSGVSGVQRKATVVVITEAALPSRVENIRVLSKDVHHISLAWDKPNDPSIIIEEYEVKFYSLSDPYNISRVHVEKQNISIKGLDPTHVYVFQVRAKTTEGWGEFSESIHITLEDIGSRPAPSEAPIGIIAGAIVAVVACMVIVIIMVILLRRSVIVFLKRNHRACAEKNVSDCETLQYSNVTVPLFTPPGAVRTYIDPHTYEDPQQAVREFTKEIDASHIIIESVIGGGEFGDVCKGKLRLPGKMDMCVAIKTLKPGASEKNRLDFLTEASIMGQFDDPNVIYLEGVVTKSNPIMIVTEYMENGSLDSFLRNNDGKFTSIQLVGMLRGIAAGMRYLSEMGYVHRDLAARNILVNENLVCKVSDFGLSREIDTQDNTDGAYTTKGGKIPVRWTAPEAIAFRKFTSSSDVWSYGVVSWEVLAYGERPYWNWSNQDVIKAVDKGYRLPPPMDCPEATYQLMLDCWQKERSHRPKFAAIVKTLEKLIRAPELLRKIAKQKQPDLLDPETTDVTRYTSIQDWLTSIKMDRYIETFLTAGFLNMDMVSHITLKDLLNMEITLIGHQKKIMNSVQTLRAQMNQLDQINSLHIEGGVQLSEGFLV
ncbi:unnamed protein product, partial [Owenia fusiformis]